jgi:hypothetical protein
VTAPFENTASVTTAVVDPSFPPCVLDPNQCEDETAANQGNTSDSVTTSVGGAAVDLAVVSISDTPDPVNPGQELQYTIIAVNSGTSATDAIASPAQVKIELPQNGITFVSAAGTNGFNCSQSGSTVTCEGDFEGAGNPLLNNTEITVRVAVLAGAPSPLTLVAIADPTNQYLEANEGDNSSTAQTTVSGSACSPNCIDLVLAQVLGSPDPVAAGGTETFTVQLTNAGDTSTASGGGDNATMTIDVAGSFSGPPAAPTIALTNAPTDTFSCSLTTNDPGHADYTCAGNLSGGEGVTVTFAVTATAGGSESITTQADAVLVYPGALYAEFNTGNNSASYTTAVAQ